MAGSKERERELARQRWERQQRARAEAKRRSRRRQQIIGSVLAVIVIIGGIFFLVKPFSNELGDLHLYAKDQREERLASAARPAYVDSTQDRYPHRRDHDQSRRDRHAA